MKNLGSKIILLSMTLLPAISVAHPGHGVDKVDGYSVLHYLTEPQHLVVAGVIISLILVIWRYAFRKKSAVNKKHDA